VQGAGAAPDIIRAIEYFDRTKSVDVIIAGRGGGSIEDLWAFNSEQLARKIYESPVPVISAVGHETDFTICDFVADLRAPTPSAAAELAVPDMVEMEARLLRYQSLLKTFLEGKYNYLNTRLDLCLNSPCFKNPTDFIIGRKYEYLDRITDKISAQSKEILSSAENRLTSALGKLEALSPLKVLSRGFAAVTDKNGAVSSAKQLKKGEEIKLKFADGSAVCEINKIAIEE